MIIFGDIPIGVPILGVPMFGDPALIERGASMRLPPLKRSYIAYSSEMY